jgi:hypothetical protein
MCRSVYFLIMVGVVLTVAPMSRAAPIVVLTEEPVAEFTLPDGSVLKNAYVWRRTSEGLMIIHDDGQFFLNYKTLPDAWRKAYAIDDSVEQVSTVASKRYDQYSLYPVLERVGLMPRTTVTFLKSKRYEGQADPVLLSLCALQAVLDHDQTDAARLNRVVINSFTNFPALTIDEFMMSCESCEGAGNSEINCGACGGGGACAKCGGEGELQSEFIGKDPLRCTTCKGTGKCSKCGGDGKFRFKCEKCGGDGLLIDEAKVKARQVEYIRILDAVRTGMPWSMPTRETDAEPSGEED